jgi:hypothetical protein
MVWAVFVFRQIVEEPLREDILRYYAALSASIPEHIVLNDDTPV